MTLALVFVPIMAAGGMTLDYTRAVTFRSKLEMALDAATLALARTPPMENAAAQTYVQQRVEAIMGSDPAGSWQITMVQDHNSYVEASATGVVDTAIMGIAQIDYVNVAAHSEVIRERKNMEVALVLDNTGSMGGGNKIGALRDAASSLVTILYSNPLWQNSVKVAMVPFVTAVNIKSPSVFSMNWVDSSAQSAHHGENFDESGGPVNHLTLFDQISNTSWKGCVEARPSPYDLDDTPPDPGNPDTLWVPYFWPDEPDWGGDYHNNYLNDEVSGSTEERQASTVKYDGGSASIDENPSVTRGPNMACGQPIVPLTNNATYLQDQISEMRSWDGSGTNIAQGMVWGLRVLSPEEPYTEGVAFGTQDTLKAMVVLTDGENLIWGGWDSHNKSNYTSYGYLSQNRLGTTDKNTAKGKVNDKVETLCNTIKAQGVRIYTITFQLGSSTLQNLFRDCATSPELYYNSPSNEELQTAFELIGYDLSNLRISK